jgi:hypothetical protein
MKNVPKGNYASTFTPYPTYSETNHDCLQSTSSADDKHVVDKASDVVWEEGYEVISTSLKHKKSNPLPDSDSDNDQNDPEWELRNPQPRLTTTCQVHVAPMAQLHCFSCKANSYFSLNLLKI